MSKGQSMSKQEATKIEQPPRIPVGDFVPHCDDPFLSMDECGLLVGRTRQTIRKWCDEGLIRAIRDPGGYRRVRKSELVRFYGATALADERPLQTEEVIDNG